MNTPLISIFADNDDYYIPVVELDFFNPKGLHSHHRDDLTQWDIEGDYDVLFNKYHDDLALALNRFTLDAVNRKYLSTIPITDESKITKYHHLKTDYELKTMTVNEDDLISLKLKKLALRDHIMRKSNLKLNQIIDYGHVLGFISEDKIEEMSVEFTFKGNLEDELMDSEYLIEYYNHCFEDSIYFESLNSGFIFKKSSDDTIDFINSNRDIEFTVYRLNNTDFLDISHEITNTNVNYDFTTIPNAIPHFNSKKLDLNAFGEVKTYKFKINNLDELLNELNMEELSIFTFYLELFMSGRVNQIINKFKIYNENYDLDDEFETIPLDGLTVYKPSGRLPKHLRDLGTPIIHIIYSSGDTLIAEGPAEDITRFGDEFEKRFSKWTAFSERFRITSEII